VPAPIPVVDLKAYSDASSEIGIGIIIGEQWRAWRLLPGWKDRGRDIGWAESVGFLLLISSLTQRAQPHSHLQVFGDNQGVVEGWWKGRSRNKPTNDVFKIIHDITQENQVCIYTRYVPSELNPADGPSRGIYGHPALLLPPISVPESIQPWITDFNSPLTPAELSSLRKSGPQIPRPKPSSAQRHWGHIACGTHSSEESEDFTGLEAEANSRPF
jgi:hypothetical protein